MLNSLAKLFSAPKKRIAGKTVTRRGTHRHAARSLELQSLEPRLALAITATQTILTTTVPTLAWDIQIDDTVNGIGPLPAGNTFGNGTNAYLQAATDGGNFFLLADNPAFNNARTLPFLVPITGTNYTNTTVYVHSAVASTKSLSFTAFASSVIPTQRLLVQLDPAGSQISIGTPWQAALGTISGTIDGVDRDPAFYRFFGGSYGAAGQVVLNADDVRVSSAISTTTRFNSSAPNLTNLSIDAALTAVNVGVDLKGTTTQAGQMRVGTAGSITSSGPMIIDSQYSNIYFAGAVSAPTQTYLLRAPGSTAQYDFMTKASATSVTTGLISGTTVAMTLGQPAGGTIDLKTSVANLRFDSGVNASAVPYRYTVAIDEQTALTVDAVAASSGSISIKAGGDMTVVGSAIRTSGDIALASTGTLTIFGDIATANGTITLDAPALTLGSGVTAGGTRNINLVSRTGSTTASSLTRAGGAVKQTVRVASIQNVTLAGTTTLDGVTLATGDRVLLKNQTTAANNGIYVYDAAGGGSLTRSSDADTAVELSPGFAVFVSGGTQTGGWTLLNPSAPVLGQTGLQFAPISAARTYDEVKAATTATDGPLANGNIPLSGTATTIDGVAVIAGDRVLVKNQSNAAQNGIYLVSAGAWQRASDADATAELTAGSFVFVQTGGATNGGTGFALSSDVVQVGTTALNFANFFTTASGSTAWAPAHGLTDAAVATTVNIRLTGLQTVDGAALAGGERVLVKNQINPSENGVYIAAAGVWARATDADAASGLPRSTAVYVTGGTQGQNTSWQFNDSTQLLGTTTANNANVTNLVSTAGLAVGMLVTGAGIPGGTTIASLGSNGTSLRLSQNATLSGSLTALSFVKNTAVVVGTDPVVFIPIGGGLTITSATSIGGSSLLQGATGLLTAGTANAPASTINASANFGRLSASSPGAIVVTNATSLELQNVRTTTAGGISVTANGTLTAVSVAATGTAGTPGNVALTSIYGDVVAESITSTLGNIDLTSINGSVAVTKARLNSANVSASAGNITATADAAGAVITIDGRLNAGGAAGIGDISLLSNAGQLAFTGAANVVAADQLLISTPNSVPTIPNGAQIAAARLDLTSQFGNGVNTLPAGLGTYQVVAINRTDAGDITFTSTADLTVEGASTSDGSITFTAPNLTITGAILPQGPGADADVTLTANAGNLFIDTPVTSQRDVTLSATAGEVRSSTAGKATSLVTAPRDLTVNASNVANILAKASGFNSAMTAAGAALTVQDNDGLDIKSVTLSAGGTATFTIGSAGSGGDATIGKIDAGATTGTVTINAYGSILEDVVDAGVADIIANTANLTSTTGQIVIDTDVNILSAGVQQKNQNIVINDVGSTGLELKAVVGSNNANVNVTAKGPITATNVTTTGTISLTTTDPTADILVNQLSATANTVTLSAGQSILEVTPGDATPDITGSAVTLTAGTGSINVHLATSTVAATATTAGKSITLKDDDDLALAGINGKTVTVTVGGLASQTLPVIADDLTVTSTGGKDITLLHAGNKIGTFAATSSNGGVQGTISILDSDADLVLGDISGGAVVITSTGTGPITQAAAKAISATKLTVNNTAGAVVLGNAANDVASVAITNTGRAVTYADKNGFDIAAPGIAGSTVTLTAAGDITQTAAITATTILAVTNTAGSVTLGNAANDAASIAISNSGRAVTYTDHNGVDIAGTGSVGSTVTLSAAGNVTQSAAITATALAVTNAAGSVTLGNAANDAASIAITNTGRAVTYTDANGFDVAAPGIAGSTVTLSAAGNVTQTAAITATTLLAVTNTAGSVTLGNAANDAASIAISNTGRTVTYTDASGFDVAAPGIAGSTVTLSAAGNVTQSAAITATTLAVTNTSGSVVLDHSLNSVGTLASASNLGGDVTFVNGGTFSTGAVTAGTAAVGDGNILLKSVSGNINVNGNLSAVNDRVTLEARNGTFTLANGVVIDAYMLVYYVNTAPNFGSGTTIPTIVAANGNLTISQSGPITFGGYTTDGNITIIGTSVTINGVLQTTGLGKTVAITATTGTIAFVSAGAIDNAPALNGFTTLSAASGTVTGLSGTKVSGASTSLTVGQAVTFPGTIDATILTATGAGTAISLTGSNNLGTVAVTKGSDVVVNDSTGSLVLSGINATGTVTLTTAGDVTQTDVINAGALAVSANGNPITLDTQNNTVASFASSNGAGNISFKDTAGGLALAGITGGAVTIDAAGEVTQTGVVNAGAFTVNAAGNAISLNTQNNAVTSFASSNGGGSISFKDTAGDLDLAGITGGTVTIDATGAVTQSAAVDAGAFTVNGNGSAINLTTSANAVTSFASSNGAGSIAFNDTDGGLSLNGITTTGAVTITAAGIVTQSAAVNAGAFTVNGNGSDINLTNPANAVTSFASSNAAGSVTFTDSAGDLSLGTITSGSLSIAAAGPVSINQTTVKAAGNIVITTQSGGGLAVVGPQPGGLLQSATQINLAGVQGPIALVNGGQIVAPTIMGNGQNIAVGGNITSTAELDSAVAAINTLPVVSGSTYEIVIGANLSLDQTLVINRPVAMRGYNGMFTLTAGSGVTNGVVINTNAAGSRITSLAFNGFSGTGIQIQAARNVTISGITVIGTRTGTGTGLEINGVSTGTTVRGSTFTNNPFGIRLTSATGATIGGTLAGQRNTISGAARAGVFASGFCTGSSVIRTVFPRTPATPVQFNIRSSRNLRVVR